MLQKPISNNPPAMKGAIQDVGDFRIMYDPVENPDYSEVQRVLKESKLFEVVAEGLNRELSLPVDLPIHFAECGETNAAYDPERKRIEVCYELIGYIAHLFSAYLKSEDEVDNATVGATFFVLYHEIGHALIDVLGLPTTGKEEDAADQLATLALINSGEEGEEAALNAAHWFLIQGAQRTNIEELPFWDEHSLDGQRFYSIACWIYGQDSRKHSYLIEEGILPEVRAERCGSEYQKLSESWSVLLAPYFKK